MRKVQKQLYNIAGVQNLNTVFLFTDTQVCVSECGCVCRNVCDCADVCIRETVHIMGVFAGNVVFFYLFFIFCRLSSKNSSKTLTTS